MDEIIAKHDIAELRRWYGLATDHIGSQDPERVEKGRAIYHRIFTADAELGAAGVESVTGPDAWVDVVLEALQPYPATQHLIGTQVVTDLDLDAGTASMTSYLQAWHAKPDNTLWLFIGTYEDELVRVNGEWKIARMLLVKVSGDTRTVDPE